MDVDAVLRKYNPYLVILPQDPALHRPGENFLEHDDSDKGDYRPCSVEFFLSHVAQRDTPRKWNPLFFLKPEKDEDATGLDSLRAKATGAGRDSTTDWELDVSGLHSQDAGQAWRDYPELLPLLPEHAGNFVYGHYIQDAASGRHFLEYWYLYAYNDAPNRHEGDWEMVAIEVNDAGEAIAAGYSGHSNGFWRAWAEVDRNADDGRPYVYVARGSHAAYFFHDPDGHRTNSLEPHKGWVEPFETLWVTLNRTVQDVMVAARLVDHTTALSDQTSLDPKLVILPGVDDRDGRPELWWMDLRCLWGSRHSRFQGTIGPPPPWEQRNKWEQPAAWIDSLVR